MGAGGFRLYDCAVNTNDTPGAFSGATEELVRFATTEQFENLPLSVRKESKRAILDYFGATIAGRSEAAPQNALKVAIELGGNPQARVLVSGERTSTMLAALVNGIASHVLDFDDTHLPTILHATGSIMSAVLAAADWKGASGRDIIAAHALAFEFAVRVTLAITPSHHEAGWHKSGTTGTLGAAVGAGRILQLDETQMSWAVGMAATQAAGHREQFGTMSKALHMGKAASNGVLAALLAQSGYTASLNSLEGVHGLFAVMAATSHPSVMTSDLRQVWEISNNGFKPYACGVVMHPAIDAMRQLRRQHEDIAATVEAVELRVHPHVLDLCGIRRPGTALEAKFSISFAAAIALLEDSAGVQQFSSANVGRSDVARLQDRIHVIADPAVAVSAARATAHLRGGGALEAAVVASLGTPGNPISDEQLVAKFHDLAAPVLGTDRAERLAALIATLEDLPDAGVLIGAATSVATV